MGERVESSALVGGAGGAVQHRLERCVAAAGTGVNGRRGR
jgi:hypothetical protein